MTFSWRSFLVGLLCIALATIGWSIWRSGQKDGHDDQLRSTADGSNSSGATALNLPDSIVVTAADRQVQKLNPDADGWNSEVIGAAIGKRLEQLRKTVVDDLATEKLSDLTTDNFACQLVDSDRIELIHQDNAIQVRRLATDREPLEESPSLEAHFRSVMGIGDAKVDRCYFKVIELDLQADHVVATVLVDLLQAGNGSLWQSNVTCHYKWALQPESQLRLQEIAVVDFELIELSAEQRPLMQDVTTSAVGATDTYETQVQRGIDYWSERLTGIDDMHFYGHHGLAVADVDGDGLEDLYLCDSGGLPNRLYIQQKERNTARRIGRFKHRSAGSNNLRAAPGFGQRRRPGPCCGDDCRHRICLERREWDLSNARRAFGDA